jgi:hypothetical protein
MCWPLKPLAQRDDYGSFMKFLARFKLSENRLYQWDSLFEAFTAMKLMSCFLWVIRQRGLAGFK